MWYKGIKKRKSNNNKNKNPECNTYTFICITITCNRSNIPKILYGPPFYRQEKMWDDLGLVLPRNMMANWCIKISQYYLEPLYRLMLDKIKESSRLIHCDETTIQVNKEENFMIAYR